MIALLLALTFGGFNGWTNIRVIELFISTFLLLGSFLFIEYRTDQPMLDLELFRTRILAFAYCSNLLNGIARGAIVFLFVFYFQGIKGINPVTSGILLAPFALSMMIMAPISGRLSDRFGSRELSSIGLFISALGMLGMIRISADSSVLELCGWMFLSGLGSGMFVSPNTNAIMSAVPVERRGIAAGVRSMMNNLGNVISIALSMAIISSSMKGGAMQRLFSGSHTVSNGIDANNFIAGLRKVFLISFIISILAAILSYLRGPQPKWQRNIERITDNTQL